MKKISCVTVITLECVKTQNDNSVYEIALREQSHCITHTTVYSIFSACGFPNGAPWDTCLTMFPKHGGEQQASTCPFTVSLNVTSYAPEDIVARMYL